MIILGINAYHADSSAAIFVNGRLVAAIEEERFKRVKHWAGFPAESVLFCLRQAGVGFDEVDHFAIGRDPRAKLLHKMAYLAKNFRSGRKGLQSRLQNRKQVSSLEKQLSLLSGYPQDLFENKIHHVEHHRSHLASAFYASPFNEAACISIDGSGDFTTTMLAAGDGKDITVLDSIDFPHSLGIFYTAFTQLLGFPHYGDEYKVMGMAPYGQPRYVDKLQDVIHLTNDGLFKLDLSYFRKGTEGIISYGEDHVPRVESLYTEKMTDIFGAPRSSEEPLTSYHHDLAASVQKMTEITIFHLLESLQSRTGMDNICLAGGVAQNSVANGKIKRNTSFKNIYIPSAGHDAGISMGAALYVQHQVLGKKRMPPVKSAYTGSRFSNEEIKCILTEMQIDYEELNDEILFDKITDCLIKGGVAGWFNGSAEFGPRALGARSIIADPRRADAKEILNLKIKRRESFRPFAPSILKEYVSDYFEWSDEVPFMERVFPIKEEKRKEIPAVTHVDGTGRLQTVDKSVSERYYRLIDVFRQKTGVPVLLNTSFNENEPIVNSPREAVDCFLRTRMDMLAMENILLTRKS